MPRYFLHLENHNGPQPDEAGQDLPDDEIAIKEASRTVGAVLAEDMAAGIDAPKVKITVERDDGSRVALLSGNSKLERA